MPPKWAIERVIPAGSDPGTVNDGTDRAVRIAIGFEGRRDLRLLGLVDATGDSAEFRRELASLLLTEIEECRPGAARREPSPPRSPTRPPSRSRYMRADPWFASRPH